MPLPRPELAENDGSYNEGKHHEKFVPLPSLLLSSHVKTSAFSWTKTTEYVTAYICPCPSACTTLVRHHPMPSCVSPFSDQQTHLIIVHSQPDPSELLISFFVSVVSFRVHSFALSPPQVPICSLLKLSRSVVDYICPPLICLTYLQL